MVRRRRLPQCDAGQRRAREGGLQSEHVLRIRASGARIFTGQRQEVRDVSEVPLPDGIRGRATTGVIVAIR